jgi:hypothetical protein
MTETTTTWPPKSLGTVAVPAKDAYFTSAAVNRVNAPASVVFDVVRNVGDYSKWNTWIPTVDIESQPDGVAADSQRLELGTEFVFHVVMDANKPNSITDLKLVIRDISTPDKQSSSYVTPEIRENDPSFEKDLSKLYRIQWKTNGGFVARGLMAERFHEIIVISETECEVRSWEAQGGILARTVKFLYSKTLAAKFQKWNDELQKRSEELFSQQ